VPGRPLEGVTPVMVVVLPDDRQQVGASPVP